MIRGGSIDFDPRALFETGVVFTKLRAIVPGDGVALCFRQLFESFLGFCLNERHSDLVELVRNTKTAFPFHVCENTLPLCGIDNGIALPISDSASFFHNRRTFRNIPCFCGISRLFTRRSASFPPILALLTTKVRFEIGAVFVDELVNGLMGDDGAATKAF